MGFESEIQPFFELKDWPSSRLLPAQVSLLFLCLCCVLADSLSLAGVDKAGPGERGSEAGLLVSPARV